MGREVRHLIQCVAANHKTHTDINDDVVVHHVQHSGESCVSARELVKQVLRVVFSVKMGGRGRGIWTRRTANSAPNTPAGVRQELA